MSLLNYLSFLVSFLAVVISAAIRPTPEGALIRINDEYSVNINGARFSDPVYHVLDGLTNVRYANLELAPLRYRYSQDRGRYSCFFYSPMMGFPTKVFTSRTGDFLFRTGRDGNPPPYKADVIVCYTVPNPDTTVVVWVDEGRWSEDSSAEEMIGRLEFVDSSSPIGAVLDRPEYLGKAAVIDGPGMNVLRARRSRASEEDIVCWFLNDRGERLLELRPNAPRRMIAQFYSSIRCSLSGDEVIA